ncbi:hypothetical protein ACOL3B_06590 [Aliarcobacter butzleri]
MKIEDLQQSPFKFKIFLLCSIIGLIILLVINFYILPIYFESPTTLLKTLTDVFNNFTALLISSLFGVLFLYMLTPKVMSKSEIIKLEPRDLKNNLEEILKDAEFYYYYGHTARWTRSVTLPKLYEYALNKKITKEISITILDPNNIELLKYFKTYGHGERDKGNIINNIKDLKKELLSTILIGLMYDKKSFFKVNLYLSSKVSLFRFDLSDKAAILTKPHPLDPALKVYNGTFFYQSYKEEIKISQEQSRKLDFDKVEILNKEISINNLKRIFEELNLKINDLDDNDIKDIFFNIANLKKPY